MSSPPGAAKVNIDYHIEADHHYYSVPYQLVGKVVYVRSSATTIEAFYSSKRVASHLRSFKRGQFTTDPATCPSRTGATRNGPRAASSTGRVPPAPRPRSSSRRSSDPGPSRAGFRSALGIIRLADRYGTERVEAACGRALHLRAYSYRSVQSILVHSLDKQPLPEARPNRPHPRHHNVRGATYYQ